MRAALTKVAYDIGIVGAAIAAFYLTTQGFESSSNEAVAFLVVGAGAAAVIAYATRNGIG